MGAYGEWVPVDKTDKVAAVSRKALTTAPVAPAAPSSLCETEAEGSPEAVEQPAFGSLKDSVFPDPLTQVRSGSILFTLGVCLYVIENPP